jgi:outer membrane receptor protein involved in Fe transport
MLFYGGFTHGFKSGGFNLDSSAAVGGADPRFDSEQVDVWEIGMKALFWDRRLRANIAVFSQEMEDFQVQGFTGVRFQTFNVDKAESVGVELETFARFTDYFSGSLGLTYADTEYPNDCAPLDPAQPGYSPIPANLCGNALTNAPELVAIVGFTYERPIFDDSMVFFIDSTARYEDDRRTGGQPTELQRPDLPIPGDIQDSNTKVNLRFGLQSFDERWALEVWGNNIFDERTRNAIFNIPLRGAEGDRAIGQFVQEPATYGVTLRANF